MVASIGVIGAGTISRSVHLPVLTAMPEVRVAWVADASDGQASAVAAAFDVPHAPIAGITGVIRDCDAVLLAIPVGVRGPYLEELARQGVAVLVEKPFARNRQEFAANLALFPEHRVACGFMRRTYSSTQQMRTILREGWFGAPVRVRIAEGGRTTRTGADRSYFDDPAAGGGGILLELGCHALDQVLYLLGTERHDIVSQRMLLDGHADRKAEAEVLLHPGPGGGGQPVVLEYVFSWLDTQDNCVEFEFPTARVRYATRPDAHVVICGTGQGAPGLPLELPARGVTTTNQAFYTEWKWLLDGLATGVPSPVAAATCREVTALIEDLYLAARTTP
jgi:predicted dehydrogenase